MLTSLAIVALGTVNFISRGITGSHDVGRSLTGGPFLEPARRNVAEFDLCRGGGGAYIYNSDKGKKTDLKYEGIHNVHVYHRIPITSTPLPPVAFRSEKYNNQSIK